MNRFVVLIASSIVASSAASAAEYGVCGGASVGGGDLVYLAKTQRKPCWKKVVSNRDVNSDDLFVKHDSFQFSYVFSERTDGKKYDPIFNVQIKEINAGDGELDWRIELYRKEITSLCGKRFRVRYEKFLQKEFKPRRVSGFKFNR